MPLIMLNIYFLLAIIFGRHNFKWDMVMMLFCVFFVIMAIMAFFSLSFDAAVRELLKYALFPLAYGFFKTHVNTHANDQAKESDKTGKIAKVFYFGFVFLMVFGMLGMAGVSPIYGMVTDIGGRLQSFFQYANTTALAMGIGAFYATEKFKSTKKWLHIIMAGLFFVALIFTLSRVSFVVFVLCYLLYIFQFVSLKFKLLSLGTLGGLVIALIMAGSRIAQISIFAPTLVERYISYYDALGMMMGNPFGIGLGNWQFLQFYHQSAPYNVLYIHNAYLQIGLDGGFLALAIFLFAIGLSFFKARKGRCIHFYIGVFILINAFFEVHFNFGIIIVYFMFLLAVLNKDIKPLKTPAWAFGKYVKYARHVKHVKYAAVVPIVFLLVLLVANAHINTAQALKARGQIIEAHQAFAIAHSINPLSHSLHINLAATAPTPYIALDHLYKALDINDLDPLAIYMLAQNHMAMGDFEAAYLHAYRLLEIFPFSTRNQDLLREIIETFEYQRRTDLLDALEARIAIINGGINPLFRHISPDMSY